MSKKKTKGSLVESKAGQALTAEQILAHPVVRQMSTQLEQLRNLVQSLPEAVGRSVAAAMKAGAGTPLEPSYHMVDTTAPGVEVNIGKDKIVVGEQVFPVAPMKLKPRPDGPNADRTPKSASV